MKSRPLSHEKAAAGRGRYADVRLVNSHENRSAGA
jgi:hypothetical protein